ncbi:vitamin K epoxide reductase family protein [Legionella jamestowniensis]|uniref:DNA polymerase III subunit epsilon n=2 Tax=Legionella jamestowniensis TaxID=455 RepID=A0A0W0UJK6_9GAMM|nr:vitamin K epoxide reductase family protein [Legionella jamestowniensis]KTD07895.1 NAD dependent epimerase/dehydratase [Legionella jamestowniensis]OCH99027.1 DNA polymerase III subunit epsilon [Legionella jamestowniensis]SFL63789.1 Nucleoside-diphosphate-sugar epimerase [Legionella jamestowniensis DSM 19215]
MTSKGMKPIVIITGSAGNIGSALTSQLKDDYHVVGFDRAGSGSDFEIDLTSKPSIELAFKNFREKYGNHIAAVIHLAAYFDFTGENSPLYDAVNVKGTQKLLAVLQDFEVERFIFSSTMLVHQPGKPGKTINEDSSIEPKWAYPKSKWRTEQIVQKEHGPIPYLILRLAGVYDDSSCIPTLANQITRVYERDFKSHLFSGDMDAGQSFIHREDMINLFKKALEYRNELPAEEIVLGGEPEIFSYEELQERITCLIHGEKGDILNIPPPLAKAAAAMQNKLEPLVPDDFDEGEKPFIRPFMIDRASDHYDLNIEKARTKLHWVPKHSIYETLPKIINALKTNPKQWYKNNGLNLPDWLESLPPKIDVSREQYETLFRTEHQQNLWAYFIIIGLGFWLIASPVSLGYESNALIISDIVSGAAVAMLACLALSWRLAFARWLCAGVGCWIITAPLVFWAPTAAAYLNDTLIGSFIIGFSVCLRPFVGVAPNAMLTGPDIPSGWDFSPSSYFQRLPIIVLAFIGLFISRYLAAYQLGHIDRVWDPFFAGALPDNKNGTEEIITSSVSEAWPVPDAGLGAMVYLLEIVAGIIGGVNRWRTMPWLVLLFGILIVPLGVVSITFIIIQPIVLDTWCTLCLIAAVAMLMQVPYSFDELVATSVFLWRRWKAGRPLLRIFLVGDSDDNPNDKKEIQDNFEQSPWKIIRQTLDGGVSLPWNLVLCLIIGVWLMFTRLTLDTSGGMANADHLIGALIVTVTVTALAEVARAIRFLNLIFALALLITPFVYGASGIATVASLMCGILLFVLCIPRGKIVSSYGEWNKFIV